MKVCRSETYLADSNSLHALQAETRKEAMNNGDVWPEKMHAWIVFDFV
jgi:hypothetical protein